LRLSKIYKQNEAEIGSSRCLNILEKLRKIAETHQFDKQFLEVQLKKKKEKTAKLKTAVSNVNSLVQRLIDSESSAAPTVLLDCHSTVEQSTPRRSEA
jgi:hypothetical protein